MATDGMRTLIDHALSDSSLCEALLDIQEYKKSLVARFSKEDLEILEDAGFQFSNNYVTQETSSKHSSQNTPNAQVATSKHLLTKSRTSQRNKSNNGTTKEHKEEEEPNNSQRQTKRESKRSLNHLLMMMTTNQMKKKTKLKEFQTFPKTLKIIE